MEKLCDAFRKKGFWNSLRQFSRQRLNGLYVRKRLDLIRHLCLRYIRSHRDDGHHHIAPAEYRIDLLFILIYSGPLSCSHSGISVEITVHSLRSIHGDKRYDRRGKHRISCLKYLPGKSIKIRQKRPVGEPLNQRRHPKNQCRHQ